MLRFLRWGPAQEVKKSGGGNIFDKIGSWFSDRKDDASHAADKASDKVKK